MKKISLGNKKAKIVLASIVLLVGVQGAHTYKVTEDNKVKEVRISELSDSLNESSGKIEKLQRSLNDSKESFDNKSKEAKELEDKLKKEQDNLKKLKVELKDAIAKKQQRLDKQYAVNDDTQEVAQSGSESVQAVASSTSAPSGNSMVFESTAYDGYAMGGMTASGVRINSQGDRIIAVDPSVIPLGSRVYVEGYGEAIAADTGGAIKGNIIDLNMSEAEAIQWGRRPVNITVLD